MITTRRFQPNTAKHLRSGTLTIKPLAAMLRASLLGLSLSLLTAPLTTVGYAGAQQSQSISYNIPAGPLEQSLNQFSRLSDMTLSYPPSLVQSQQAPALVGNYAPEQALEILLTDTGLDAVANDAGYRLVSNNPDADSIALETLNVQGESVLGFLATRSSTATKTDTPILETPQSISVITEDRIEMQNVDSLGEALRYTPGIQGETFGFEPRFTFLRIRGFDATTTGLFRNSLQLRNPNFAGAYSLEPYGAERVEVVRGPSSVLYGAGSPGGLVNYVSKRPTDRPLHEVGIEVGSFDHVEGKFDLGGPIGDGGDLSYRLTGLVRDSETQVDFIDDDRLFIAPAMTWRPSDKTSLTVLAHFQEDETKPSQALPADGTLKPNPNGRIPLDRYTGEPDVDKYERSDYSLGYEFEHQPSERLTFRQKLSYYGNELDDVTVFSNTVNPDQRTINRAIFSTDGNIDGLALDNHLQADMTTGPAEHTLLFGVDYQRVDVGLVQKFGGAPSIDVFNPVYGTPVPPPPVFNDSDILQEQIGFYIQDQIKLYDKLILTLGGRYDDASTESDNNLNNTSSDQDDTEFTSRFGVMYQSDFGLTPYFSYAESFLPSSGSDSNGKQFEPETGELYELGIKFQPSGSNSLLTAAIFDLTRENFTETDPATFLTVQTGEIRSRGLELEGVASFDFGLDLIATYTYLDMEIRESVRNGEVGERPTQTPEHTASLWADYAFQSNALRGLHLGGGVRYIGSSFGDLPNTLKVPSEVIVDAAARYDLGDIELRLNVKNLFNERHIASAFSRSGSEFATFGQKRTVVGSILYRF